MVHITAVDPLAEEYKRLLAEFGITPPVRTQLGEVERLTRYFPKDHFDLVNMENALDHSYNPLLGLRQMIGVVKPGCHVLLLHNVNEAHNTGHAGFHQWNCCADNGNFVIWNSYTRVSVNAALEDVAQVKDITVHDDDDLAEGFMTVSLRKKDIGK